MPFLLELHEIWHLEANCHNKNSHFLFHCKNSHSFSHIHNYHILSTSHKHIQRLFNPHENLHSCIYTCKNFTIHLYKDFFSLYFLTWIIILLIYIYKKLVTIVEGNWKACFSLAITPRYRGRCYSFPCIAPLYSWCLPYNGRHQVPFLSLWIKPRIKP